MPGSLIIVSLQYCSLILQDTVPCQDLNPLQIPVIKTGSLQLYAGITLHKALVARVPSCSRTLQAAWDTVPVCLMEDNARQGSISRRCAAMPGRLAGSHSRLGLKRCAIRE